MILMAAQGIRPKLWPCQELGLDSVRKAMAKGV